MAMKYVTGGALALVVLISIIASSIGIHDARKRDQDGRHFWATSALISNLILGAYVAYKVFLAKDARGRHLTNSAVAGAMSGLSGLGKSY